MKQNKKPKFIDTENKLVFARGRGMGEMDKEVQRVQKKSKGRSFNIYANSKFCLSKIIYEEHLGK